MSAVESIFQVNFRFAYQIIAAKKVPVENLHVEDRILRERGLKFKAPKRWLDAAAFVVRTTNNGLLSKNGIQLLGDVIFFIGHSFRAKLQD